MIEECAHVVAIGEGCAWVETQRQSTCGACGIKPGCGAATLAAVLGQRRAPVRVLNTLPVDIGDQVIIGIAEQALLQGSTAVYLTPLLTMVLGAVLGRWMWSPPSEALSVVAGLLGLAGGLLWLRAFSRKIRTDSRFQPIVLRLLA
jgi:sigma-E factor negative regulatory protein RseC